MAKEIGIPLEEDYLVIRREINPNGKSMARINGVMVQAGVLKIFASQFLNIYGQHDFQILSDPANHLHILDNAGIDKIYKKEKPWLFIWATAISAMSNFYFFYMICIFFTPVFLQPLIILCERYDFVTGNSLSSASSIYLDWI